MHARSEARSSLARLRLQPMRSLPSMRAPAMSARSKLCRAGVQKVGQAHEHGRLGHGAQRSPENHGQGKRRADLQHCSEQLVKLQPLSDAMLKLMFRRSS